MGGLKKLGPPQRLVLRAVEAQILVHNRSSVPRARKLDSGAGRRQGANQIRVAGGPGFPVVVREAAQEEGGCVVRRAKSRQTRTGLYLFVGRRVYFGSWELPRVASSRSLISEYSLLDGAGGSRVMQLSCLSVLSHSSGGGTFSKSIKVWADGVQRWVSRQQRARKQAADKKN